MSAVCHALGDDGGSVRRVLAWVVVAVAAVVTGAVLVASRTGSTVPLLFVIAAFPQLALFGVALVSAAVLVLAARAHLRIVTAAGLFVLVVSAGLGIGSTADRQAPVRTAASTSTKAGQLRILSWNTNQQDVTAQHLGELMDSEQANVVALPEYFTGIAEGTLAELAQRHNMQIVGTDSSSATLLISNHLGSYSVVDQKGTPAWAGFVATSDDPAAPAMLVAHLQRPSLLDSSAWQDHLAWVKQECTDRRNIVAVGDFNATVANLDGNRLGHCQDAASSLGIQSTGTWPAALPASLGAAIDHTFVGADWEPVAFAVLDSQAAKGSDHRPIVAVVDPKGS
ncbi:endonuclease/exonuclease/phosphatase family protein [Frondihabitans sp. PhB161]|nr:endonuclease/exonuclease/phosphatase family protein [Frondihabitans sp. PhB153]RPF08910.1 endonuclease/exonuclease/phosphatase family protein [Frondihabitans sp. PhB161]